MNGAWLNLMKSTITVSPFLSLDQYGMPSYGTAVDVRARISETPMRVVDQAGQEVIAVSTAWTDAGSLVVSSKDKVIFPDGSTPSLIAVQRVPDHTGTVYTRLSFGR